ncbi:hypothetical protein GAY31_13830 [Azospirillum brasilense]|nr:hypothetical protein [Azospirillum brasilense]
MSALLKPEEIELVAGAFGVSEAFVEKDWHVVRVLSALAPLVVHDCRLVFGGGTSLSLGYGLIRRFSEDIDFRLTPDEFVTGLTEGKRRSVRKKVEEVITGLGYTIPEDRTERWNGNKMFTLFVPYDPRFSDERLRPEVKVEVTLEAPRFEPQTRTIASFVSRYHKTAPEVTSILCVDPVETAVDKLSGLSWRSFENRDLPDDAPKGELKRDRTLVRHVHDLCALESTADADPRFLPLLKELIERDNSKRGKRTRDIRPTDPKALMASAITILRENPFPQDYKTFALGMTYGGNPFDYITAIAAVERLCSKLV